ncbi:DUF2950 domain-containing protein [Vineibacter terrae]|nr:DUF2950 domain-containing protein [Vineibacter terrae]
MQRVASFCRAACYRPTIVIAALAVSLTAGSADAQQKFATPQAAAAALVEAARAKDVDRLKALFGAELQKLTGLTDRNVVAQKAAEFLRLADDALKLEAKDERTRVVRVGQTAWPMAIPIVRHGGTWQFDVIAGREEIIDRIVGENEMEALETCVAYLRAQQAYAGVDRDGDDVPEYAQRFVSTPGKRDGLYWLSPDQADRSPIIEEVAAAGVDPVVAGAAPGQPEPYYGYYFRILTRQGPTAPGGAHSYIINGNMIAGHALIAYPARWGESGVMTFVVNRQGRIYQKNLGPNTETVVRQITEYNPDKTWELVQD